MYVMMELYSVCMVQTFYLCFARKVVEIWNSNRSKKQEKERHVIGCKSFTKQKIRETATLWKQTHALAEKWVTVDVVCVDSAFMHHSSSKQADFNNASP